MSVAVPIEHHHGATNAREGRYLTFRLDDEVYGVPILDVREIIELQDITPVPRTPHYVCGVINLRGRVLPLVDLRRRFGLPTVEPTELTVNIVLQSGGSTYGCLIDEVLEVHWMDAESLSDAPVSGPSEVFLSGLGRARDRLVFLLDLTASVGLDSLEGL